MRINPNMFVLCRSGLGCGFVEVCWMRLRGPGRSWGVVVVSAAVLLLLAALGLALVLILTRKSLLHLPFVITDNDIKYFETRAPSVVLTCSSFKKTKPCFKPDIPLMLQKYSFSD